MKLEASLIVLQRENINEWTVEHIKLSLYPPRTKIGKVIIYASRPIRKHEKDYPTHNLKFTVRDSH